MIKKILEKKPLTILLIVLIIVCIVLQVRLWNRQNIVMNNQGIIARTLSVAVNTLHIPQRDGNGVPQLNEDGNELNIPIGLMVEAIYKTQSDIKEQCKSYENDNTKAED